MTVPLTSLKLKSSGKIAEIQSDTVLLKLIEMGVMPGVIFSVQNRAPFNGPLAILVNGTKVIIRRKEAECILVEA